MRSNHLAGLDSAVVHQSGPSCSSDAHLLHSLVILTILMFLISIHAWAQSSGPQPASNPLIQLSDSQKVKIASAYGKLPLSFEANRGQSDSQIKFFSRGPGYSLFLTDHEAVLSLRGQEPREQSAVMAGPGSAPVRATQFRGDVIRLQLLGSHLPLHVNGENLLPGSANYFIGNDPTKWLSAIPTYARVRYAEVYPGVSLVYYGNQQHLEYDFVVAPGADPSSIRLRVAGVQRLEITKAGDLQVTGRYGEIAFHKPVIYQQIGGRLSR